MKDWLGQEYDVGDTILYAASSGRSITMVLAEVIGFTEKGNVTVQPLGASRWKQHWGRTRWIDNRTGKGIDPFATDKHTKVPGHRVHKETGVKITEKQFNALIRDRHLSLRKDVSEWRSYKYVPTEFHDYVERVKEETKKVTLTVTENITKVPAELRKENQ